jgi:hypothetical protein
VAKAVREITKLLGHRGQVGVENYENFSRRGFESRPNVLRFTDAGTFGQRCVPAGYQKKRAV